MFLLAARVFANDLTDGYNSFIKNDYKQAALHFTAATSNAESKAEAYLMLSLISSIDKEQSVSFNYFLEFYKSSPNPFPYIMALMHHSAVLGYGDLKSKAQLNWLLELYKRSDLSNDLRSFLASELAKHYESCNEFKKAKEYYAQIEPVTKWQIVGDFENISASGFDKNYGPLDHPEQNSIFKNKINANVNWFDVYKLMPGKWVDLTYNFNCNNTLVYAQSFCNSPLEQTVYVRIGTSGSLKLWVNDQLLFTEEEERNNNLDTYIVPVKLAKGNNRILLQIACSKITQCNYMVRVTDKEGNINSNLTFSTTYAPYSKTKQEVQAPIASATETFLTAQIKQHPEKLVNYLALANILLSNDKTHDALTVLSQAQTLAPNNSFILYQMLELYLRERNNTLANLTQEKLKQVDPENPYVLNYIINDNFSSENYKDARKNIELKEKLYGTNLDIYYLKIKLASAENNADDYAALVDKLYLQYPSNYTFVYDKYQFEKDYRKNQKLAIKVLKDYTKAYYNKEALSLLAEEYIESGQFTQGIDIQKKLIEIQPANDNNYKTLGLLLLQAGVYPEAKQNLEECLKIAPFYGPYHGYYAQYFEKVGYKDNAINEYKLNLNYSPDDYDAINKLRDLQNKKEVFDYFPKKDYYKLFANSPSAADYPNDNFISLTEERQVVLHENKGCEIRQVLMFKALTLKGIDYLKEYNIGYYRNERLTVEKAEVLKKNGNRLQAEVKDNQIVYTSLEPGDAVFLIYKKSKTVSDQISKEYCEKILLNSWYPSLNIECNLLTAKSLKFDYKLQHTEVKPTISEADEFTLYSWKKTNNQAMDLESYMPALMDVNDLLNISTFKSWNSISKLYYDISNTKTKPTVEITEAVNELLKGKEKASELEKAKILYNFIIQNIRYSSVSFRQNGIVPQRASDVLLSRIGDCKDLAVLFTSMCKVAGIKSELVLVITRDNGSNWLTSPSFDFNHAMAKAKLDGKDYFLELTSSYMPFAALGEADLKATILEVNNDTTVVTNPKVLDPPTRLSNSLVREVRATFNGDNMTKTVKAKRTGALTVYTRSSYRDLGKDDREKTFTKSLTDSYSNIKLVSLKFDSTLYSCSDTVNYNYTYIAPKVFTKINNLSIVKLPLVERLLPKDFLSLDERKYPIEAWKYDGYDEVSEKLVVVFPENKTLAEVPKSVKYSCKQADYSLTFSVKGNELTVVRVLTNKQDYIPLADYAEYRNFIDLVVNADGQQIGFK